MQGHGRARRHRPRPLRHLRRRRPQQRPAVRARPRPQGQVVRLRLQRPARQLPGAEATSCSPRATTTSSATPTPRSSCTRWPTSSRRRTSEPDWVGVFRRLAEKFDGAYNIVLITAHGELVVARDPLGFRPLCIAEHGPLFAAASESVPLANLGFRNIRSLEPGTLAVANQDGVRIERFAPSPRQAHCFFEWIYFANVASTLDDRSVYLSRSALGKELARLEDVPLDADTIVVPVPDTAKAAADAMAFALEDSLGRGADAQPLRRPDVHRGDRRPRRQGPAQVHAAARGARRQARPAGRGQHRPLDDDAGPGARDPRPRRRPRDPPPRRLPADHRPVLLRHRHVAARDELFATRFVDLPGGGVSEAAQQAMARELGADSLRYLPVEAIARSVSLSPERLCRACITGHYPTETGQQLYQIEAGDRPRHGPDVSAPTSASQRPEPWPSARPIAARVTGPGRQLGIVAPSASSHCVSAPGRSAAPRCGTCARSWSGSRGRARAP